MGLHLLLNFQCFLVLLCLQLASTIGTPITPSKVITKPGCQDKCGNVSIHYPFGIGDGCAIDDVHFKIRCSETFPDNIIPVYGDNLNVSNISTEDGEMTIALFISTDCSDKSLQSVNYNTNLVQFTFSNTKNKFIAIGCDTLALNSVTISGNISITGCLSSCNKIGDATNGTCNGIGCCEASIPSGLTKYGVQVRGISPSGRRTLDFNRCSYAFLTETNSFNFSSSYLKNFNNYGTVGVPAVVDWTIGTETCEEAQRNLTSYACGPNSVCKQGNNGAKGYLCGCKPGYDGNPYLNKSTGGHCQDVNECIRGTHNCTGPGSNCTNTEGSFNCYCNNGYTAANGTRECSPNQNRSMINQIVVGASLSFSLLLVTGFWLYWVYRKRKHMKVKEEFFKQNGGLILNRLLDERKEDIETNKNSSKSGRGEKKHRSIATIYTEKELSKATNNYHDSQILGRGGFGTVYKGTLSNGKVVAI